ncbi:hypothetical protein AgCh_016182 [Apium graveolens]
MLVTFPTPTISGRSRVHSAYEMKSDYSEWFVEYQIGLVPISRVFPEMKDFSFYHTVKSSYNAAEYFKEALFLVMELPERILSSTSPNCDAISPYKVQASGHISEKLNNKELTGRGIINPEKPFHNKEIEAPMIPAMSALGLTAIVTIPKRV